jgi:hypothetical protein
MMFTDKAAILQAAATLAAAEQTISGQDRMGRRSPVERLIGILTEMEKRGLIPPGTTPSEPDPDYVPMTILS